MKQFNDNTDALYVLKHMQSDMGMRQERIERVLAIMVIMMMGRQVKRTYEVWEQVTKAICDHFREVDPGAPTKGAS